jgi:hypothetical protein
VSDEPRVFADCHCKRRRIRPTSADTIPAPMLTDAEVSAEWQEKQRLDTPDAGAFAAPPLRRG